MRRTLLCAGSVLLLLCMAPLGHADSFTYQLGVNYEGDTPGGAGPWLTATFADAGEGEVKLTLQANALAPDAYVAYFYFNTNYTNFIGAVYDQASSGPPGTIGTDAFDAGGASDFDLRFQFPGSGNYFDSSDVVIYLLVGSSPNLPLLSASSFNLKNDDSNGAYYAAAMLKSKTIVEAASWIGATSSIAPVPEPATMLLFGMGLSGLGLWIRRRSAH
jgi:hypothetical protein